ncbi:hypothetical protein BD289DRAFT_426993 [Coniella lustricola]|uniref:Uncharacterized protein n=1 Tax=Coniella lustricola TaxID=2025994 RepID=A0A2T3AFI5_9PEZI|nr:hypothetical protein BD289DRAFT_426993 [Coniella lustricola]
MVLAYDPGGGRRAICRLEMQSAKQCDELLLTLYFLWGRFCPPPPSIASIAEWASGNALLYLAAAHGCTAAQESSQRQDTDLDMTLNKMVSRYLPGNDRAARVAAVEGGWWAEFGKRASTPPGRLKTGYTDREWVHILIWSFQTGVDAVGCQVWLRYVCVSTRECCVYNFSVGRRRHCQCCCCCCCYFRRRRESRRGAGCRLKIDEVGPKVPCNMTVAFSQANIAPCSCRRGQVPAMIGAAMAALVSWARGQPVFSDLTTVSQPSNGKWPDKRWNMARLTLGSMHTTIPSWLPPPRLGALPSWPRCMLWRAPDRLGRAMLLAQASRPSSLSKREGRHGQRHACWYKTQWVQAERTSGCGNATDASALPLAIVPRASTQQQVQDGRAS